MSDHEHGSMDITQQQKTFEGFLRFSAVVTIISIVALIFLAIVGT